MKTILAILLGLVVLFVIGLIGVAVSTFFAFVLPLVHPGVLVGIVAVILLGTAYVIGEGFF
jgi:hypothetical protein